MKAVVYEEFRGPLSIRSVPDPVPSENGVVIEVKASGLCRSDWHGWMGHDPDIKLPHVPGHELAGIVAAVGKKIKNWRVGDRVTVPFVCGCGACPQCDSGNQQVCDHQFQPGFTNWGSFAQYVAINYADLNLVRLPDDLEFVTAATIGCRFITSYRAVLDQGAVSEGQWIAVYGCGGVGLSAIMIAKAAGARVIAIDIDDQKLAFANQIGAEVTINAAQSDPVESIMDRCGGVHVSIDALGSQETCFNSIASLRKRGRHIQVGLMTGDHLHPSLPMDQVIAKELEIRGSHGMQAHKYPEMFELIRKENIDLKQLIGKTINLEDSIKSLPAMNRNEGTGITIINKF